MLNGYYEIYEGGSCIILDQVDGSFWSNVRIVKSNESQHSWKFKQVPREPTQFTLHVNDRRGFVYTQNEGDVVHVKYQDVGRYMKGVPLKLSFTNGYFYDKDGRYLNVTKDGAFLREEKQLFRIIKKLTNFTLTVQDPIKSRAITKSLVESRTTQETVKPVKRYLLFEKTSSSYKKRYITIHKDAMYLSSYNSSEPNTKWIWKEQNNRFMLYPDLPFTGTRPYIQMDLTVGTGEPLLVSHVQGKLVVNSTYLSAENNAAGEHSKIIIDDTKGLTIVKEEYIHYPYINDAVFEGLSTDQSKCITHSSVSSSEQSRYRIIECLLHNHRVSPMNLNLEESKEGEVYQQVSKINNMAIEWHPSVSNPINGEITLYRTTSSGEHMYTKTYSGFLRLAYDTTTIENIIILETSDTDKFENIARFRVKRVPLRISNANTVMQMQADKNVIYKDRSRPWILILSTITGLLICIYCFLNYHELTKDSSHNN